MNATELKENVLTILRGNSVTKDVEALTEFQMYGFEFAEAQEQLKKAKAYLARMQQTATVAVQEPAQENVVDENTVNLSAGAPVTRHIGQIWCFFGKNVHFSERFSINP